MKRDNRDEDYDGEERGVEGAVEKVAPLVPAPASYTRTVDDIAREKALPDFERAMQAVRSVGRSVYADAEGAAA